MKYSTPKGRQPGRQTAAAAQSSAKRQALGLVNFDPPVAHHFCLALPAAFTQPGANLLAEPCIAADDAYCYVHSSFARWI